MKLTVHQLLLLQKGVERNRALSVLHRDGSYSATLAKTLIGKRCKKFDTEYEITDIYYGFDGYVCAHGYKIVTGDKRGRKTWDIGPITPRAFE